MDGELKPEAAPAEGPANEDPPRSDESPEGGRSDAANDQASTNCHAGESALIVT